MVSSSLKIHFKRWKLTLPSHVLPKLKYKRWKLPVKNLLYVQEINTPNRYGGIEYIGFEKLTYFPIQTKLVDLSLVSHDKITITIRKFGKRFRHCWKDQLVNDFGTIHEPFSNSDPNP